jgi:preprotein translocase SecE subunit
VARNRKRTRDRRPRLPESARVGAGAGLGDDGDGAAPGREVESAAAESVPGSLMHAAPDAELADAQLALGRPELAEVPNAEELEEFEESEAAADVRRGSEVAPRRPAHVAESHVSLPSRFFGFLRGSWLELHRVQWPDRRQVMQATGVVLGFVIVAGVYLGLADLVASKLVNLIIK